MWTSLKPPTANKEYSPQELKEPIRIIREIVDTDLPGTPVIAAQRRYLAHFAEAKHVYLAYTDLKRLIRYLDLNQVDFLYLKHNRVDKYPFYAEYQEGGLPERFVLIYSGLDANGENVQMYRLLKRS